MSINLTTFATGTHLQLLKQLLKCSDNKISIDVVERVNGSVDLRVAQSVILVPTT
jgi:hypothetical protein